MKWHALSSLIFGVLASALTVSEINGPAFLSPYNGQTVANISGLVTAVGPSGFFLRDTRTTAVRGSSKKSPGSSSIYVFGASLIKSVKAGDTIQIGSAKVAEYRSSSAYIYLTELTSATNITTISSGNTVTPIKVGKGGLQPPNKQFSKLDGGDVFAVPNNQSLVSKTNATLQPNDYGLDFWESLSGELVSIEAPVALGKNNSFGDIWIRGDWKVTGLNKRGGLTITTKGDSGADANPEAIIIGSPLDGTTNSPAKLGDRLSPFTGVVTYAFGFYRILPTTRLTVTSSLTTEAPPTTFKSSGSCKGITVGQYNVENLSPSSAHLPGVAAQIVDYMKTPDLLFLQEVQDNDGPANSGTVSANETLSKLAAAIEERSGFRYSFADVAPVNNQDGGQPGGNIRTAYFYNPAVLSLYGNATAGLPTDAVEVLPGPTLNYNPGRLDPANEAWTNSRKPLIAAFSVKGSKTPLFAINVHFGSKGGSSSIQGDARPPVNGGVDDRTAQATLVGQFVEKLVAQDPNARIMAVGDFNEFSFVAPMRVLEGDGMLEIDEVVGIPKEERYTYVFDMNCQQLDHMLVSKGMKKKVKGFEHLHLSSWAQVEVSDHDPSVGLVDLC